MLLITPLTENKLLTYKTDYSVKMVRKNTSFVLNSVAHSDLNAHEILTA